jgi:hypothetical protein
MSSIFGTNEKTPLWCGRAFCVPEPCRVPTVTARRAKVRQRGLVSWLTVGVRGQERRREGSTWPGEAYPAGRTFPAVLRMHTSLWASQCHPYSLSSQLTDWHAALLSWQTFRPVGDYTSWHIPSAFGVGAHSICLTFSPFCRTVGQLNWIRARCGWMVNTYLFICSGHNFWALAILQGWSYSSEKEIWDGGGQSAPNKQDNFKDSSPPLSVVSLILNDKFQKWLISYHLHAVFE